jgi:hypothetical protein
VQAEFVRIACGLTCNAGVTLLAEAAGGPHAVVRAAGEQVRRDRARGAVALSGPLV